MLFFVGQHRARSGLRYIESELHPRGAPDATVELSPSVSRFCTGDLSESCQQRYARQNGA